MRNSRKRRALASQASRREFGMRNDGASFVSSVDLRHDDATRNFVKIVHSLFGLQKAYCAPASKARLMRSECVILMRTSGETPIAAITAVEVCIDSSLIWPCSQSMMMPWSIFSGFVLQAES